MKIIFAFVMVALSAGAYGQLVKCVDKGGKVEYARDCPPGTTEQKTGIKSSPAGPSSSGTPAAQQSLSERDAAFKKRMIEQQEAAQKDAKKDANNAQMRQDCDAAQSYLKSIESGQRLSRTDPQSGERVFLEDSERDAEATRARTRMAEACK